MVAQTSDAALQAQALAVEAAVQAALMAEAHAGDSAARSHGLSIYVPTPDDDWDRYDDLVLARGARGGKWIRGHRQKTHEP